MYELSDFIDGVEILKACGGLKDDHIGARHEEIYISDPKGPISDDDLRRLEDLGWFHDGKRGWTFGTI